MKLKKIVIHRFRNIEDIHVRPSTGLTGFWGINGQGKTNILEAIFAGIAGKSFRPYSSRSDWINHRIIPSEHEEFVIGPISMELESDRGQEIHLKTYSSSQGSRNLKTEINQKKSRFSSVRSLVPIVVFSPDDHSLIRHSPETRRSFVDEIFSDVVPGYAEVLERFERTLKNRNKLLRAHRENNFLKPTQEMRAFTEIYISSAEELFNIRMDIWPKFQHQFLKITGQLFELAETCLSLDYLADSLSAESNKKSLNFTLEESWAKDLSTGWTHRGPHRDDLFIKFDNLDAKTKASQGQARLLALGLKWTHALWVLEEREEKPLFLIDDLSSELDAQRRSRLLDMLKELSCQVFISGTDPSLVDFQTISDYTHYRVEKGHISPL